MTREEKLISMTGATLIQLADNLGVKVACNKTRTQLKESKKNVVDRIIAVESTQINTEDTSEIEDNKVVEHKLVQMPGIEKLEELKKEYSHEEELSDEEYANIGLEIAEQAKEKARKHRECKK